MESGGTPKTELTDLKKANVVRVVVITIWSSFWFRIAIITEL
jgi:hypothetical protein